MKHSFWLVNSLLLILLVCTFIFMFFSQQRVSYSLRLEPQMPLQQETYSTMPVQTRLIYENDLFNTYHKTYAPITVPNYLESSLPQPPSPATPDRPATTHRKFLPSLKIKLKGVVALDDHSLNRIIVADDQTQNQYTYKVGDIVEDGLLIKIFPNKAVFLRSNGQQETLYLNEKDIEEDALISQQKKYWSNIIKHVKGNEYVLDHKAFVKCIHTVGVLFELCNITTLYENGISKGLRLGTLKQNSLPVYLGFESYDIITHIDSHPALTLSDQNECYKIATSKNYGDTLTVTVERQGRAVQISYKLEDLKDPFDTDLQEVRTKNSTMRTPIDEELQKERIKLLKKKYKFAPTAQDLKIQQKLISVRKNNEPNATI